MPLKSVPQLNAAQLVNVLHTQLNEHWRWADPLHEERRELALLNLHESIRLKLRFLRRAEVREDTLSGGCYCRVF